MATHTNITLGTAPAVTAPGTLPPLLPTAMRAADRLRIEALISALVDILDAADCEGDELLRWVRL